jgi:glycerol-3-phosphate dehydrogenase
LAFTLALRPAVSLWALNAEHVDAMRAARENLGCFPGFALPKEGSLLKQ